MPFASATRSLLTAADRCARGYRPGTVQLITNLAAFTLDLGSSRFVLTESFPWTTFDELERETGFALGRGDLDGVPIVTAPGPDELRILREEVDPLGIRRLEFCPSRDRLPLLTATIAAEDALATEVLGTPYWR